MTATNYNWHLDKARALKINFALPKEISTHRNYVKNPRTARQLFLLELKSSHLGPLQSVKGFKKKPFAFKGLNRQNRFSFREMKTKS